jgi:PHP family Zn ribbon phosphoesterase
MATYTIDLHNHTPLIPTDYRGDPATTPRQIVERALELGIDVWGIADHWSVAYAARLIQAADEVAEQTGVRLLVIPGAEIRIKHLAEETHLVCLFPPERAASAFADLLERLGLSDPVAPFEELPHFAVDCDPLEVAGAVDAIGGICYVGHVDRTFGEYRFIDSELVHQLVECEAVLAIELIDHACRDCFRDGLGIAHISSSDSHALAEMGRRTARLEMPESSFEGLREGLRALRGVAE